MCGWMSVRMKSTEVSLSLSLLLLLFEVVVRVPLV